MQYVLECRGGGIFCSEMGNEACTGTKCAVENGIKYSTCVVEYRKSM